MSKSKLDPKVGITIVNNTDGTVHEITRETSLKKARRVVERLMRKKWFSGWSVCVYDAGCPKP